MNLYIFADIEGIGGIPSSDYVMPEGRYYSLGRKYFAGDINACARACFEAGAEKVIVRDGHGSGLNLDWADLDERIQLIQGETPYVRFPGIVGCDAMILLGYHAMAGTEGAVLEHTYWSRGIQNMWLNGTRVGEFAVDTAIAAEYGVPVIMTSGCDKLCAEAKRFLPEVVTCQVKISTGVQSARMLSPSCVHKLIAAKTKEAIANRDRVPVRRISPVTLRTEYIERLPPPKTRGCVAVDGRTWEITSESVERALYNQ